MVQDMTKFNWDTIKLYSIFIAALIISALGHKWSEFFGLLIGGGLIYLCVITSKEEK